MCILGKMYRLSIVWGFCWLVRNLTFMDCCLMFCVSFVISSSLWPKKRLLGFRSCACGIYFVNLMCGYSHWH